MGQVAGGVKSGISPITVLYQGFSGWSSSTLGGERPALPSPYLPLTIVRLRPPSLRWGHVTHNVKPQCGEGGLAGCPNIGKKRTYEFKKFKKPIPLEVKIQRWLSESGVKSANINAL